MNTAHINIDLRKGTDLGLTERQIESAAWAAEGKVDEEIGMIIGRKARTAKAHIINAMERTDTHTRAQLVATLFMKGVFAARCAAVAAVCIAVSMQSPDVNDEIARRVRTRRDRDFASLEEATDLPDFLEQQWLKAAKGVTA
ncbi:MAG: helix-turn-helix transcriptional regulator [Amphritea sp.]|nr:helix-turn-helix transcriptional regulator [Amphritea sp.]